MFTSVIHKKNNKFEPHDLFKCLLSMLVLWIALYLEMTVYKVVQWLWQYLFVTESTCMVGSSFRTWPSQMMVMMMTIITRICEVTLIIFKLSVWSKCFCKSVEDRTYVVCLWDCLHVYSVLDDKAADWTQHGSKSNFMYSRLKYMILNNILQHI